MAHLCYVWAHMGACLTGDVRREHCDYGGTNEILAGPDEIRREIVANLSQFASRFIVIMAGLKKFWRVTTKSGGKSSLPIAICFQVKVPTVRKTDTCQRMLAIRCEGKVPVGYRQE